jgi:hypothetical protein
MGEGCFGRIACSYVKALARAKAAIIALCFGTLSLSSIIFIIAASYVPSEITPQRWASCDFLGDFFGDFFEVDLDGAGA